MTLRAELLLVAPDGTLELSVIHAYTYQGRLGELWELVVEVGSDDPDLELVALLRAAAELRSEEEAIPLRVKGIVRSVEQLTSEPGGQSRYRISVMPELWALTQNRTRRIFQEQDVIVTSVQVLSEAAATRELLLLPGAMTEAHPAVPHRTQYDESDYAFLRRIWLEEGFVPVLDRAPDPESEVGADLPVVRLYDDTTLIPVEVEVPFQPLAQGAHSSHRGLRAVAVERGTVAVPERSSTRDYDFLRPALALDGSATRRAGTFRDDMEVFSFGVETPAGDLDLRARRQLEAIQHATGRAVLSTTATLFPGRGIKLTGHPAGEPSLVVAAVMTTVRSLSSGEVHREHRVEAVVQSLRFRLSPPPRRRAEGVQSAIVVGDGEIDVDEQGSVLVRFPWDRRPESERDPKRSSRRVRVAQSWAGPGYGLITIPRVGDEVLVSFLDADPDAPVVTGRLNNGQNLSQLSLPDQRTQSSWRSRSSPGGELFNEILMEDLAGEEFLSITAGRDFFTWVGRDWESYVGRDYTMNVEGKSIVQVKQGTQTSVVGGAQKHVVGDSETTCTGKWSVKAENVAISANDKVDVDARNVFVRAEGLWVRTTDATQFNTENFHVFAGKIVLRSGASSITLEGGDITLEARGGVTINGALVKLNCD